MAEPRPHLLHIFSTFGLGGPQTRFVSLANALGRRYRHSILAMDSDHAAAEGLARDVDYAIETMPVQKTSSISPANLWNARRLLRRLRPDLMLTYNWGAIEWALANRPLVARHIHIEDGFGRDESAQRQLPKRVIARRFLLARCARVVVPSQTLHDIALRVWRLSPRQVLYVPNGIDCDRFAVPPDAALLAGLGIPDDVLVIGTIAGLRPEKNIARLVRVFAALPAVPPSRLVIVGDGPERAEIAAAAARLEVADRVVFAGALAAPERIIGRFDIFALSSDTEQMPNSVLEAMAASRPVASPDVGDVKRMVAAENQAFVIAPADEAALADAIAALARNPGRRAAIGQANRARALRDFRLETMVARYDALFAGQDGAARAGGAAE